MVLRGPLGSVWRLDLLLTPPLFCIYLIHVPPLPIKTDEPLVPRGGDTDVRLDSKAEGRHGKPKALGAIAKLIGSLRAGVAEDAAGDEASGATKLKLRGAVVDDGAAGEVAEKTSRFQDLKGGVLADDAEIGEGELMFLYFTYVGDRRLYSSYHYLTSFDCSVDHSLGKDTEKMIVGGISEATAVFLAEYERGKHLLLCPIFIFFCGSRPLSLTHPLAHQLLAQDQYAHTWAKNTLFQMRDDYGEKAIVCYNIIL